MARRALRKLIPDVDVTGVLYELPELTQLWDTSALFGRDGDLVVEIGSGKGLFLRNAAQARPDSLFVGIELARKYAHYTAARVVQRGLSNVRVIHGNASEFLSNVLPDSAATEVHVYFPDPWWKKRHQRRRLMQSTTVRSIERVLRPGGRLHFWTDVRDYFEYAVQLLTTHTELTGPHEVPERSAEHDMDYQTHFERRVRANQLPVYRAEFLKL